MRVMKQTTRRLTYRGDPAAVSMLVQMLAEVGATVEWERPIEQRSIGAIGRDVAVTIVAWGAYDAIKAAVARFLEQMHGKADATVEDNNQDDQPRGRHAV
ncbi:hypothetical protein GALL_330240 [mine drainage metagenome]|uniref:Uncharacterized protein n=1 Tax=mine drainage metagenome TaxID=410659 RepID=A0A1J5QP10_9ZZZZ